jgi:WD40 repeat protein
MASPASEKMRYGDDPGMAWGHPARIFDLAFSPRSPDVLASGAEDGTARVWRRSADDPHLWKQVSVLIVDR